MQAEYSPLQRSVCWLVVQQAIVVVGWACWTLVHGALLDPKARLGDLVSLGIVLVAAGITALKVLLGPNRSLWLESFYGLGRCWFGSIAAVTGGISRTAAGPARWFATREAAVRPTALRAPRAATVVVVHPAQETTSPAALVAGPEGS